MQSKQKNRCGKNLSLCTEGTASAAGIVTFASGSTGNGEEVPRFHVESGSPSSTNSKESRYEMGGDLRWIEPVAERVTWTGTLMGWCSSGNERVARQPPHPLVSGGNGSNGGGGGEIEAKTASSRAVVLVYTTID